MAESNPAVATIEQARLIANDIGQSVGQSVGFIDPNTGFIDPITILTIAQIAIPLLIKLFSACQSTLPANASPEDKAAELKKYLASVYDPATKSFPPFVVRKCRPQVRLAAINNGQQFRGPKQLNAITTATLIRGMNAD